MRQPSREDMEEAIRNMPASDKIDLVDAIWDSIEEKDIALAPTVRSLLEKRLETYEQDKLRARGWQEVRKRWKKDGQP